MRTFALSLCLIVGSAAAARADVRWTLEFESIDARTETVNGVEGAGNYLYWVFKVKNNSGEDCPVVLSIDVETDVEGRSYRAGFDPVVKRAAERRLGRELKSLSEARKDKLADGEEIEIIATFGKIDPNVDLFHFIVDGLKDRVYVDKHRTWVQDNLRMFSFERKGDEYLRQFDLLTAKGDKWISRKDRDELKRGVRRR